MKLYFLTFFLSLTAIWIFNFKVDISGLRSSASVTDLSSSQSVDQTLVSINELDQRAWVKGKLSNQKNCPNVLVLGSSTLSLIESWMVPGKSFLNAWLSQPTIEDLEAISEMLARSQCHPSTIMLGIDHWLLNSKYNYERWISIKEEFFDYVKKNKGIFAVFAYSESFEMLVRSYWSKFSERISYTTTRAALREIAKSKSNHLETSPVYLSKASEAQICKEVTESATIRRGDGSVLRCPQWNYSNSETEKIAKAYIITNSHFIKDWKEVDLNRLKRLSRVVENFNKTGSKVFLLATPFHPITFQAFQESEKIQRLFSSLDSSLTSISKQSNAIYLNFRNPSSIQCHPGEFLDSHHADTNCSNKLTKAMLESAISN